MAEQEIKNPNETKPEPPTQPSEQKPTGSPKKNDSLLYPSSAKYARRKKQRNIALIVTGIGAVGTLMLGIIAFLGQVSGQFTIKMDPRVAPAHLKLMEQVDGTVSEHLTADGLNDAHLTTASSVLDYVDTLKADNELSGSHNISKNTTIDGEESTIGTALIYTFYAENISPTDEAIFDCTMTIDDYKSPTNASVQPYAYLRVALYQNLYVADGTGTHDCTIYALQSQTLNAAGDYRECISTNTLVDDVKTPKYKYAGGDGYCTPFEDSYTIFDNREISLQPKQKLRYTIVAWMEGNDRDCFGDAPEGSSFTFSMNFTAH